MVHAQLETTVFWSARGEVACQEHAPDEHDPRWIDERWKPIPTASQGRHGRRYQCQHCAAGARTIVHAPRAPRGGSS